MDRTGMIEIFTLQIHYILITALRRESTLLKMHKNYNVKYHLELKRGKYVSCWQSVIHGFIIILFFFFPKEDFLYTVGLGES